MVGPQDAVRRRHHSTGAVPSCSERPLKSAREWWFMRAAFAPIENFHLAGKGQEPLHVGASQCLRAGCCYTHLRCPVHVAQHGLAVRHQLTCPTDRAFLRIPRLTMGIYEFLTEPAASAMTLGLGTNLPSHTHGTRNMHPVLMELSKTVPAIGCEDSSVWHWQSPMVLHGRPTLFAIG